MKNILFILFMFVCVFNACVPQEVNTEIVNYGINDGPYVFYTDDFLHVKLIEQNIFKEYNISPSEFSANKNRINVTCSYNDLVEVFDDTPNHNQAYYNVDHIVAMSDAHGQFEYYKALLIAHGVIDQSLHWIFGSGHFVFNGDIFDRGDGVTEILWHLFSLEKQAAAAGGKVHVLLGNHENLVLSNDLTYISEKYKAVEEIMQCSYRDLFSERSVLGKWLRNKPVVISINDVLFVHGGISMEMVDMQLTLMQINKICSDKIMGKDSLDYDDEQVKLLSGDYGPLWYRGYFNDTLFSENILDEILQFYAMRKIVVGHTTTETIENLYHNKVIGIDAGMGYGEEGEVLIIEKGNLYRGTIRGEQIRL